MSDAPPPLTEAIPVGWRAQLDPRPRLRRLRDSANAIAQIVVAATAAYSFAHYLLGHPAPLIAATVTVSSLGLVRDARPRRVLQTVLGMLVGILVAEVIAMVAGSGWWQLAIALAVTMTVARLLSAHAGFTIAAAIQAIIVIVVPAETPFLRLVDGVVGGIAALAVTALIPRNPHKAERRDAAALFLAVQKTMDTLVQSLRRGDRLRAERGLQRARALQKHVDRWADSLDSGLSIARISPFLRRARGELLRHDRVRQAMDLATRNLRVVARRAVYQTDDRRPRVAGRDRARHGAGGGLARRHRARPGRARGREGGGLPAGPSDDPSRRGPRGAEPHRRDAPARDRPAHGHRDDTRRGAGVPAASLTVAVTAAVRRPPTAR